MRKNNRSIGSNAALALLVAVAALECATDAPGTTERNKGVVRDWRGGTVGDPQGHAALGSDDPKRAGLYNHSARSSYRSPLSLGVDC
jgi:hypothetical protein